MQERNYTVYAHTAPNGKVYVGITGQKPEKRWKANGLGYQTQSYFFKAISKYGFDNFKHEILFENLSKEEAEQKEMELITLYKSNQPEFGYNIREGGSLSSWREDSKEKLRQANLGKHHSEETKKKLSEINKGKHLSEETKEKISKNNAKIWQGKHLSEEHRKKLSEAKKGKPCTDIQRKNLYHVGGTNGKSRKVIQYDLSLNILKEWECLADAYRGLGLSTKCNGITLCCRGKRKTAYGYIWRYVNER